MPSKDQIKAWIEQNPGLSTKRDIARAFDVRGDQRIVLKHLLRELENEGILTRRGSRLLAQGELAPVSVLKVLAPDGNGDLFAEPMEKERSEGTSRILIVPGKGDLALGAGDRILARLAKVTAEDHDWEARLIRRIGQGARKIVGVFHLGNGEGRIQPIDKGETREWSVAPDVTMGARNGELVEAESVRGRLLGLPQARIVARIGDPSAPKAVSLIAIHQHGIPDEFPLETLREAEEAQPVPMGKREDLRDLPLVTIDPSDARDHDDAVAAMADDDPGNPGGFILWVAIADVAAYVGPGSALDHEARKRGNSTYFPDRVVPMLPEALSAGLCSLHEGEDRPCMAVRMQIDSAGNKIAHRFCRGMMRSQAGLVYEEVQQAKDGSPNERLAPLMTDAITPLYDAYAALKRARDRREPLDLDLPERRIILSETGHVTSVDFKERLDAHRLIEEFMILANVAAAEELKRLKQPFLYRVHEEPGPEKLEALRELAEASGFVLAKGQVLQTRHLNSLLRQAEGTDSDHLINNATLRAMTQAYYSPENFGHFGLALRNYAHFTSPIRRYSDIIVHRALISAHHWGRDGLSEFDIDNLKETAEQISGTERRSMEAERDTVDRYLAAWLSDQVGAEFHGRVSGVQRFGIFVTLDESGADGLVPIRDIGREFFHYDPASQTLMGADTGTSISVGQRVTVRLGEAVPTTGGMVLELLEIEDSALPSGRHGKKRGAPVRRKFGQAKAKAAKRGAAQRRR